MKHRTMAGIGFAISGFLVITANLNAESISLAGSWKFFRGDNPVYASVEFEDDSWSLINLPARKLMPSATAEKNPELRGDGLKRGYVWYRFRLYLKEKPTGDYLLQIGEIMNADETYLNGELVGRTGRFPPHFRSGWSNFRSYNVKQGLLKQGENVVAIRVYFDGEAWISGPMEMVSPEIGSSRKMLQDLALHSGLQSLAVLLLAVGVFFLSYYVQRRSEIENLYFAFACIAVALAIALQFFENLYPYSPLSSNLTFTITQAGLIFFGPMLSLFHKYQQDGKSTALRLILTLAPPLAATTLMLLAEDRSGKLFVRNVFLVTIPIFILDLVWRSIKALRKGDNRGFIVLLGLIPALLLSLHDILAFGVNLIESNVALFVYGLPLFLLLIALQLTRRFVLNLNENERLKLSFRRFVPIEFLSILGKQTISDIRLGDSTEREMTVLFTDIREFTTLSEGMTPDDNFKFLNSYLKRMVPVIRQSHGFVDKYIGDSILSLFPRNPSDAISAAILMNDELARFNAQRILKGFSPVRTGTGIHTGRLMLGTIGETERMDGTVISDAVNLASRVEGLTKLFSASILVTQETLAGLDPGGSFPHRLLDRVRVVGKTVPAFIFEILQGATASNEFDMKQKLKNQFEEAIELYFIGKFGDAIRLLESIKRMNPLDRAVDIYLDRARHFQANSVPAGWDGVTILTEK
ncbi:MAG: adenylate/guanylate cyclase domain-containing protein [Spirochaetia bacterium]|nr:adenylate/guanylate cyclase domain-containing protein [Spirochaetia bacterium]